MWKTMKQIQELISKNKKNEDITMAKQRGGTGFWCFSSDKIDMYILRDLNTTDFCILNCLQLNFCAIFKKPNDHKIGLLLLG